jgi:glutamyl-tRNA reductase
LEYLKILAFTHKQIDLKSLGKLVICEQSLDDRLKNIQRELDVKEVFYIGTCNRVEFVFTTSREVDREFILRFLTVLNMGLPEEYMDKFIENVSVYEQVEAFNHLLRTSCSLESLVVGEKEILAQVRLYADDHEPCSKNCQRGLYPYQYFQESCISCFPCLP